MMRSLRERFNRQIRVDRKTGCWIWTGAKNGGYGVLGRGKKKEGLVRAHRAAWELFRGPIPTGCWVLHRCDVRACCNPDHLFLGDAEANSKDMAKKGRGNYSGLEKAVAVRVARQRAKRECKRGHLLSGRNLRIKKNGSRKCHQCAVLMQRLRREKK